MYLFQICSINVGLRWIRRYTSRIRLLPDFIIAGAEKCGTSSLHAALAMHECIASCVTKEPSFFDIKFERGLSWYRKHFPTRIRKLHNSFRGLDFMTFESTVSYIYHPHAPRRISQTLPRVKLILMLRNPVDRAYSSYWYRRAEWNDFEFQTFEDAIKFEIENNIAEQERKKILDDERYPYHRYYRYSYLARGMYTEQLENLFSYFRRDRVFIIKSEDYFKDPAKVYTEVLRFLGLKESLPDRFPVKKKGYHPEMSHSTRKKLQEYFEPHNERLYQILGVKFDWN